MLFQSLSVRKNLVSNNRPIYLTSLMVTMERIILSMLTDILTANGLRLFQPVWILQKPFYNTSIS